MTADADAGPAVVAVAAVAVRGTADFASAATSPQRGAAHLAPPHHHPHPAAAAAGGGGGDASSMRQRRTTWTTSSLCVVVYCAHLLRYKIRDEVQILVILVGRTVARRSQTVRACGDASIWLSSCA